MALPHPLHYMSLCSTPPPWVGGVTGVGGMEPGIFFPQGPTWLLVALLVPKSLQTKIPHKGGKGDEREADGIKYSLLFVKIVFFNNNISE